MAIIQGFRDCIELYIKEHEKDEIPQSGCHEVLLENLYASFPSSKKFCSQILFGKISHSTSLKSWYSHCNINWLYSGKKRRIFIQVRDLNGISKTNVDINLFLELFPDIFNINIENFKTSAKLPKSYNFRTPSKSPELEEVNSIPSTERLQPTQLFSTTTSITPKRNRSDSLDSENQTFKKQTPKGTSKRKLKDDSNFEKPIKRRIPYEVIRQNKDSKTKLHRDNHSIFLQTLEKLGYNTIQEQILYLQDMNEYLIKIYNLSPAILQNNLKEDKNDQEIEKRLKKLKPRHQLQIYKDIFYKNPMERIALPTKLYRKKFKLRAKATLQRKHILQTNLKKKIVNDFLHEHSRLDTYSRKINISDKNDKDKEFHYLRYRPDTLRRMYSFLFLNSDEYREYVKYYRKKISCSSFCKLAKNCCPCIRKPTFIACADEIDEEMSYMLKAAREKTAKHKCGFACCTNENNPLSSLKTFMKHMCCEEINFPAKTIEGKIFPKACCYESNENQHFFSCKKCEEKRNSENCILNCPTLWNGDEVSWRKFEKIPLENGSETTNVIIHKGTMKELRERIKEFFHQDYAPHCWRTTWAYFLRKDNQIRLKPNQIYIQTDFSAQIELLGSKTPTCQFSPHANLAVWVVLHSPSRDANNKIRYKCDHIRVIYPVSGKQKDQDWFTHCKTFEKVIEYYKSIIPDLDTIYIWTDGCAAQYKCRHNFCFISQRKDINIIHRFGETNQMKGIHDQSGQAAKNVYRNREKFEVERCTTAYELYLTFKEQLSEPTEKKTFAYSGIFKPDNYIWWFGSPPVPDTNWEIDIVLNRETDMWDSNECKGCQSRYEFRNIRPRKEKKFSNCNLIMRDFGCPCDNCDNCNTFGEDQYPCLNKDICGELHQKNMVLKPFDHEKRQKEKDKRLKRKATAAANNS